MPGRALRLRGYFMKPLNSFSTKGVVAGVSWHRCSCAEDKQPLTFSRTHSKGGINPWMFRPTCTLVSTACPAGEALIAHNWAANRWKLNGAGGGCSGRGTGLEHPLPCSGRAAAPKRPAGIEVALLLPR